MSRPEFYWMSVINHFEKKGYIQNGLTIPFLIGSREVVEPDNKLLSVKLLVEELSEFGCTMLKCGNIGEFVVGSLDAYTITNKHLYHCIDNIVVTDSSLDGLENTDTLISFLEYEYNTHINAGNFSKNDGQWTQFTTDEIKRLSEIV